MDKLDDTTYLNMRKFHERNTAGEKKKWTMMGRVLPPFKKAKGPIVYYVPEGDGGFQKSVVYQNFSPPKKIITNESCTPSWQYIAILKIHPSPPIPSRPSLFFHPWALIS